MKHGLRTPLLLGALAFAAVFVIEAIDNSTWQMACTAGFFVAVAYFVHQGTGTG